jgi:hypothetical protein
MAEAIRNPAYGNWWIPHGSIINLLGPMPVLIEILKPRRGGTNVLRGMRVLQTAIALFAPSIEIVWRRHGHRFDLDLIAAG